MVCVLAPLVLGSVFSPWWLLSWCITIPAACTTIIIISGGKGTGKTRELLEKAKAEDYVVACENPTKMAARAYEYGIFGLTFIHYDDVAIFNVAYPDKKNLVEYLSVKYSVSSFFAIGGS